MIGRLLRWSGGIISLLLLLTLVSVSWLIATESGARWLLAQASPYLPEPLSIESLDGTLLRGLEFRNVSWRDEAARVSVAELAARLELLPLVRREVRISTLAITDVDVVLTESATRADDSAPLNVNIPITLRLESVSIEDVRVARASEEFLVETIELGGELSGSVLTLRRFDLQSALVDISLSLDAELSGNYPLDASATWELRLPDQPPLSGVLRLDGNAAGYELQHDLDAPYDVATRGRIVFADAGMILDLDNRWDLVVMAAGDAPSIELVDGAVHVGGSVDNLEFDGATTVVSANIPAVAAEARGRFDGERIDFNLLSVANDWGKLRANGILLIAPELDWSFDVELSELDPSIADARFEGRLALSGRTAGRLVQKQPSLELQIERLSGTLNGYPVAGSGALSYGDERLQFDDAVLGVGDNRIRFDGSYGRELSINADANFPDLSQLGLGVAGVVKGNVRLATDRNRLLANGTVRGESLAWDTLVIDSLTADFDLPASGDGTVVLQVASAEQGSVATEIRGRFVNDEWVGAITSLQLSRDWMGEWTLRDAANFSLSRSRLKFERFCLDTAAIDGNVCGAMDYEIAGPLRFEASIDAVPVAALPRYLPEGATLLGEIGAEATGIFADGRLNANASLQINGLGLIATFEGDEASAMFERAALTATIADNRLVGEFELRLDNASDHASGRLELDDLFDPRSALRGQGNLTLNDLSLFSFFVPDLARARGEIFGQIEAGGNLIAPAFAGEIGLRDGSVNIGRAGISVTEIGLLLRQSKAGELSLQGSAKSGDGYLQIDGMTSFGTETGIRSEIRLNGEDFRLVRIPDLQVTASPAIVVLFDERATRVSGELGIPEASITINTVPETTAKPSADAIVHRGEVAITRPRRALFVDVTTRLGEAVAFSGFGLSTRLEGSVRISGDSKSPYTGLGRVVLQEGRYQAYGQNLEIESGELIFNGPLTNPALNVRATRTASDKTVAGIQLTGTPAQLSSRVYSEPPLGDAEALSYLLTGRPLSNANAEEGDMLNQAAFALGLTTAGSVASSIRNQLGLETFGIQGGSENRKLVAGKRIGDRLLVEYAYGVIDSLGTLLLRYQLSPRLMVESRSGSVRIVDVVYSVKRP